MSDASAANRSDSQGSAKAKPPRSPVERIIVWGGILVLLLLVAAQARARIGYQMTVDALRERVLLDEGANPQSLLLKDIDQHIVGWPNRTEEKFGKTEHVVTLTWKGLLSTYGVDVRATQDTEPVVLELIPHGAPEPQLPVAEGPMEGEPTDEMARPPMGGPMGGPPGMHSAAGGRARPESETPAESGTPEAADPGAETNSEPPAESEKPAEPEASDGSTEAPPASAP